MFISFLNKTRPNYPDLSALSAHHPGEIIFYYLYDSLNIALDDYLALKENSAGSDVQNSPACEWLQFIDKQLSAAEDLATLKESEYLESIGPYYYPLSNTCFFFYKNRPADSECLTGLDLDLLEALHDIPAPDPAVQTYAKNKKTPKRYIRNKEELLRDLRMCQAALNRLGGLHKQINFWEKTLEKRRTLMACPQLLPIEPDNPPCKPEKPEEYPPGNNLWLSTLRRKKNKDLKANYQHGLKIYYIRYREYEKACDRFKAVLENWSVLGEEFRARCQAELDLAENKLLSARQHLSLYNMILARSLVHPQYQEVGVLDTFQHYLETGRAEDLQECMNIFEEECLWNDIKDGQTRIENTIYLLQNDSLHLQFAQKQIDEYLGEHKEDRETLPGA